MKKKKKKETPELSPGPPSPIQVSVMGNAPFLGSALVKQRGSKDVWWGFSRQLRQIIEI